MKTINIKILVIIILILFSCKKKSDCIDENKKDPDAICPADCPGVCGCDGKNYCNSCIAKKNGIISYTNEPCN